MLATFIPSAFVATVEAETLEAAPFEIVSQPTDVTVNEGEEATFGVVASGSGTLEYQWFADGTPISGATYSTLTIIQPTLDESGITYSVEVNDGNGDSLVSDGATLAVMPVSIAIVGQGTLDSGKQAAPRWVRLDFDSLASALHTVTVSWDSDADVRFKVHEAGGGSVSPTVRGSNPGIWQGELGANGQYYIGLWSTEGVANYIATVEAPVGLSITAQPVDLTVAEGASAAFSVVAGGSGTLGYQWFANGAPIGGATGDTLTVGNVTSADSGTVYAVEITGGGETVVSDEATLTVTRMPAAGGFAARWTMDEPAGASMMNDASGNGRDGTIGPDVVTGVADQGATSYRWPYTPPTSTYQPGRIVNVPHDPSLNPGSGDYSITMRYRTNVSFGNIVQKGQGGAPGGYWKIENPGGYLTCVFRGVASSGGWNRKEVVSSRPLNDGQYHTITCERVGTTLRLIVDGVLDDTAGNSTGSISNSQPISIGGKTNCDNATISCDYFSGWIDEISIGAPAAAPPPPPSDPGRILFADDFSGGDFLAWTRERSLSIDGSDGAAAPPSALAELYGTPGFALTDITPGTAVCAEVSVRLTPGSSLGAVDLLRMRTASNGKIAVVYLDKDSRLVMKSEVSGATEATGVRLDGAWHRLRWCGTIGGAWSLAVDGVDAVTGWRPDTGNDPIGRFQIGTSRAETITVRFDDVVVTAD